MAWAVIVPFLRSWWWCWVPRSRLVAGLMGGVAGGLEDFHSQLSFRETLERREIVEPQMWTWRTLYPSLLFFFNPLFVVSILEGEMKGSNLALAQLEGRPIQRWPFFAILGEEGPSPLGYLVGRQSFDDLLKRRLTGGFYQVKRNQKNKMWRIL